MSFRKKIHNSGVSGWVSAIAMAVLLNAVMFGLMPGLLKGGGANEPPMLFQNAVDVFRIKRPEPPLPDREKPRPKKEQKEPEEKKTAREIMPQKPVAKPRLPFEINSRLPAGPGIVPTLALEKYTTQNLGVFKVEDLDRPPQALVRIKPRTPLRAERMGIEGWVKIKYIITEQGRVEQVEVVAAEPEGIFEKAVLSAVKLWRFLPPTVDGEPVKALAEQKIIFNFNDE